MSDFTRSIMGQDAYEETQGVAQTYLLKNSLSQATAQADQDYGAALDAHARGMLSTLSQAQDQAQQQYDDLLDQRVQHLSSVLDTATQQAQDQVDQPAQTTQPAPTTRTPTAEDYEAQGTQAPGTTQAIQQTEQQYAGTKMPEEAGPANLTEGQMATGYLTAPFRAAGQNLAQSPPGRYATSAAESVGRLANPTNVARAVTGMMPLTDEDRTTLARLQEEDRQSLIDKGFPGPIPEKPADIYHTTLADTLQTATDVLNVWPTPGNQLALAEFYALQGAAQQAGRAGLLPEKIPVPLPGGQSVDLPTADLVAIAIQVARHPAQKLGSVALDRAFGASVNDAVAQGVNLALREAPEEARPAIQDVLRASTEEAGAGAAEAPTGTLPTAPRPPAAVAEAPRLEPPAPEAATTTFPPVGRNYLRPLQDFTPTVYRQATLGEALDLLPNTTSLGGTPALGRFVASTPDLALGQGAGAGGPLLEFSTAGLPGQVSRAKPFWQALYDQRQAEFTLGHVESPALRNALTAITVPANVGGSPGERTLFRRLLGQLEQQGWTREVNADGSTTFRRGAAPPTAPDISPSTSPVFGGVPVGPGLVRGAGAVVGGLAGHAADVQSQDYEKYSQPTLPDGSPNPDYNPILANRSLIGGAVAGSVGAPAVARMAGRAVPALGRLAEQEAGAEAAVPGAGRIQRTQLQPIQPRETVAEAIDRVGTMLRDGRAAPSTTAGEIERAITSIGSQFYQHVFASENPLQEAQRLVYARVGRAPTPVQDAVLQMRLFAGRSPAAAQRIEEGLLPVIKGLSSQEEAALNNYLLQADNTDKAAAIGRRVQEEALAKATAGGLVGQAQAMPAATAAGQQAAQERLFSGGVHAHDLPGIQQEFVTRYGQPTAQRIFDAAQGVWDFTADLRTQLHREGLIDAQTYTGWSQEFPHYVKADILRHLPEDGAVPVVAGQRVFSLRDIGAHALTEEGTVSARDNPINSVIRQQFAVENQIRRNRVASAIGQMIDQNPELGQAFRERAGSVADFQAAQQAGRTNIVAPDYKPAANETTFAYIKDGVAHEFVVDKNYEPLFRLDGPRLGAAGDALLDIGQALSGAPLVRQTATTLNATFIPVNAVRDAIQFLVRSDVRRLPQNMGELSRAYWDTFTAGGGADWAEALKAGAGQANPYFLKSPDETRRILLKEGYAGGRVRPISGATPAERAKNLAGAVGDVMQLVFTPVTAVGERVEQAPRLAAYRLAKSAGMTDAQAALAARDVTIDFARGGDFAKLVNRVIPFFNVGLQGPERFFTYDLRRGNRMAAAAGITTGLIASVATDAWNRWYDPQAYADVPDYLKDTGIVVMTPFSYTDSQSGEQRHIPLWIPVPNEYQLLKGITNEGVARLHGDTPADWQKVLGTLMRAISPVGTDLVPLPPTAKAVIEAQSNYDIFRGRPIVPQAQEGVPGAFQESPRLSAVSRLVAQRTDLSPFQVEHIFQTFGGGVGQQALEAGNIAARAAGVPAPPARATGAVTDIPVAGGIAGRFARTTGGGGQLLQDAWTRLDREQNAYLAQQLATLRENDGFREASPAQRQRWIQEYKNAVDRAFLPRRQALASAASRPMAEQEAVRQAVSPEGG